MAATTNAEIALGQLKARIEFETVVSGATATLKPLRVQLVLEVPKGKTTGAGIFSENVVVLGDIEVVD